MINCFKEFSNIFESALIKSIPFVGSSLEQNRIFLKNLSKVLSIEEDDIQKDISRVLNNLSETKDVITKLSNHIETQQTELKKTLEEYNQYKELASVEKEKAKPILEYLDKGKKKSIIIGLFVNLLFIVLGVFIDHYIKKWFLAKN